MPNIPEAAIAMLSCARIGAIHSVVFGGFAAPELASRIRDCQPKIVVEIQHIMYYRSSKKVINCIISSGCLFVWYRWQ